MFHRQREHVGAENLFSDDFTDFKLSLFLLQDDLDPIQELALAHALYHQPLSQFSKI